MEKENTAKIAVLCEKAIAWGLYAFAFLLPLFFMPFNANVLEMNKQLLLVVFSLFLLIAWLGKMIAEGQISLKKSLLNLGAVLFLISYLVSAIFSKNLYQSLVGTTGTIAESFISVFALMIVFFVIVNNLKTKKEILNLVFAFIVSGFLVGVFGIIQMAGKFFLPWDFTKDAAFNTVGSVNALEIFLGSLLVLGISLFAENEIARWKQIFYGVISAFFVLAIISINYSNIWWGLLIVTILVISLGIINRDRMSQYRLIMPMVVLAFSVLMLLTSATQTISFPKWLTVPSEVAPTMRATMDIDKEVLKSDLFFGSGPSSFSYDYGLHRSPDLNGTDFWNIRFNQGMSKAATLPSTTGLFGTIIWLAVVVGYAIYGFILLVRRRGENWALALGIFSSWLFLAILQFLYPTTLTLEAIFWIMLALSFLTIKTLAPKGESEKDFEKIEAISVEFNRTSPVASILSFVFVVVLVVAISVLYIGGSYYYADILYQKGLKSVNLNLVEQGSVQISKAVMLNPYNDLYLRTLSQAALLTVNNEFAKPQSADRDAKIQNLIATAINIAKRSTDLAPLNVDNWIQRGSIYRSVMPYTSGADQWAFDTYKEAIKLEPENPYYYFELGRSYTAAADLFASIAGSDKEVQAKAVDYLNKAEEAFNKSIELKPDYAPALYQQALVYDQKGNVAGAITKMKATQDQYPNDVGLAFQLGLLYYKQNSFDQARAQFERAINLDQNYSNARYFLGLIYDKQGNKSGAIAQFEWIEKLNPDNQEVKTILANLRVGKAAIETAPVNEVPIQEGAPKTQ